MAKKKKPQKLKTIEFDRDPFKPLKGFAVSDSVATVEPLPAPAPAAADLYGSFADEMAMLGVNRIVRSENDVDEEFSEKQVPEIASTPTVKNQNDEELFLQALGELDVCFSDQLPAEVAAPVASARRMKQLKQGKLSPQATLDLHGLQRAEVAAKITFFLEDAQYQGYATLLVITGKGLHSEAGEAVLRNEAELFLAAEGGKQIAEWGRAPKQYGGDGALVLFLRKSSS